MTILAKSILKCYKIKTHTSKYYKKKKKQEKSQKVYSLYTHIFINIHSIIKLIKIRKLIKYIFINKNCNNG